MNLVEPSSHVDGRLLNDSIDYIRQRSQEIGGSDLRVEKDLRTQEPLIADIHFVWLSFQVRFRHADRAGKN